MKNIYWTETNRKTKYVSAPKTWNGGTKHQKSWHAQRYGSKSM